MAQQTPGTPTYEFHGVYLAGNPLSRPRGSASACQNFRVMPGFWLRVFGGRKARWNVAPETVQQIISFRTPSLAGANQQLVQLRDGSNVVKWREMSLLTYNVSPTVLEPVSGANDGNWAASNPVAQCVLPDQPIFYNGMGERANDGSRPPFSSLFGNFLRYFGLDCYCPGGINPTVSFTPGAGLNVILQAVRIWVGVYNSSTAHYSNAVYCGEITETGTTGTITVSNLQRIKAAWHNNGEQGELNFVFYATVDASGRTPYLILNSTLDGPYTVPIASTSASLSLASGTTNGWVINEAAEAPTKNFPPQVMRCMWYANGRIYGATMPGGSGSVVGQYTFSGDYPRPDFTYQPTAEFNAGVRWCAALGDDLSTDRLGDPLQSWPIENYQATPNGDTPVCGCPIEDKASLVLTNRAAFKLTESADGIHIFDEVSLIHGIVTPLTLADSAYGRIWVDQQKQIILRQPDGQIIILSTAYQNLITAHPICGDYLLDPLNDIDCYRIWLPDGTCIVHDFEHRSTLCPYGEAYTATGQNYTFAKSILDAAGRRHHIVCNTGIYTQEGQPEDAQVLTGIETFTSGQNKSTTYTPALWMENWNDSGDCALAKEVPYVDLLGDVTRLGLSWWKNLQQPVSINEQYTAGEQAPQSEGGECLWRFFLQQSKAFWRKIRISWTPPDSGAPAVHPNANSQGDLGDSNFFGCLLRAISVYAQAINRK